MICSYYIKDYANMTIRMDNEPGNQYKIQSDNLPAVMPHLFLKSVYLLRVVKWNRETCSILLMNYKTPNTGRK